MHKIQTLLGFKLGLVYGVKFKKSKFRHKNIQVINIDNSKILIFQPNRDSAMLKEMLTFSLSAQTQTHIQFCLKLLL